MAACFRDNAHRPRATIGDNPVDSNIDEFRCQPPQCGVVELCKSKFEDNIAALDIATIPQPLTECLKNRSCVTFSGTENSDTRYPVRNLCLGRERPAKAPREHLHELAPFCIEPHPLPL